MFIEFFFFWFVLLFFSELYSSRSNVAYVCAIIFSIIMFMVIWLFWCEFDLFASMLLALYSSVFILLSLFILYFNRYWGKTGNRDISFGGNAILSIIFVVLALALSSGFFFFDGLLIIKFNCIRGNYSWIFKLVDYDYYNIAADGGVLTVFLMHNVLYKFFAIEIFFMNIYLLLGLIFSVGLLFMFKIWLNPSIVGRIFSLSRFQFFFAYPTNFRMRAANKFRRQVRRKNSSYIKHKFYAV